MEVEEGRGEAVTRGRGGGIVNGSGHRACVPARIDCTMETRPMQPAFQIVEMPAGNGTYNKLYTMLVWNYDTALVSHSLPLLTAGCRLSPYNIFSSPNYVHYRVEPFINVNHRLGYVGTFNLSTSLYRCFPIATH